MLIRCSNLPKLMTEARTKSEVLSETCKTEIKKIAKEDFFGYEKLLENKYLSKGIQCEIDSIELLNGVLFTSYEKNKERKYSDFLTGEADIVSDDLIIDIKTSWSWDTFPALHSELNVKDYEWQLRGYMYLYDKPKAMIIYCMVDTPLDLISKEWNGERTFYEPIELHKASHIAPSKRISIIELNRDMDLEAKMLERLPIMVNYYGACIDELNKK